MEDSPRRSDILVGRKRHRASSLLHPKSRKKLKQIRKFLPEPLGVTMGRKSEAEDVLIQDGGSSKSKVKIY